MKTWMRWFGGLALVVAFSGFTGCGSDEREIDHEGLRMCCEMGAYCHPPAGVIATEERQNCHNVGHANDPALCRTIYDDCMELCADNVDASEHYCDPEAQEG